MIACSYEVYLYSHLIKYVVFGELHAEILTMCSNYRLRNCVCVCVL